MSTTYLGTESAIRIKATEPTTTDAEAEFVSCTITPGRSQFRVQKIGSDFDQSYKYGIWDITGEIRANFGTADFGDAGSALYKLGWAGTPTAFYLNIYPAKASGTPCIKLSGVEFLPPPTDMGLDMIKTVRAPFRAKGGSVV